MTGSLDPPEGLSPAPNHRRHAPSIRVQGLPSPTDVGVDYSVWLSYTGAQRSRRPEGRGAGPDPASARGGARVPPLRRLRRDACQTRGGRGLRPTHTLVRLDHGGRWKPAARAKDSADTAALPLTVGTGGRLGSPSCGARRGAAAGRRAAQRGCTWRAPRTDHCHWAEADCWAGRGLRAHLRPRAPRTGRALGAETSGTPLPGARPPRGACAAGAWRAAFWES